MRKNLVSLGLVCIMSMTYIFPSFANMINSNPVRVQDVNENYTVVQYPRGSYISTASLRISNPENGEIGVFAMNLAHQDVDETSFHIYLDRWIESEKRWANIAGYDFVYNKDNCPGEDLSEKSISFNIVGQPADCYYRLRGKHIVVVGDKQEMLSTETDGILITKK